MGFTEKDSPVTGLKSRPASLTATFFFSFICWV
jgi:hypothetical protein